MVHAPERSYSTNGRFNTRATMPAGDSAMKPIDLSGNLLRVDLARRTTRIERLPDEVMKKYLGGRGLGAKMCLSSVEARAQAKKIGEEPTRQRNTNRIETRLERERQISRAPLPFLVGYL